MRRALRHLRWLLVAALVVELAAIAWLVLNPSPAVPTEAVYDVSAVLDRLGLPGPLTDTDVVEFALNVALFVPLGMTVAVLLPRVPWWLWALVGLAASSGVEALQLVFLDARSATLKDIWANTLGMALGGFAASAWVGLARRRVHASR